MGRVIEVLALSVLILLCFPPPCGHAGLVYEMLYQANAPDQTNGWWPQYRLVRAPGGIFYGVTKYGGVIDLSRYGSCGTVFRITQTGEFSVVYRFSGPDGAWPISLMLGSNGDLYGMTESGGTNYLGTCFQISSAGTLKNSVSLASHPGGSLFESAAGSILRITETGEIFKISPDGTPVLLTMLSATNGHKVVSFAAGPDGNYYGMTKWGSVSNHGPILATNGTTSVNNLKIDLPQNFYRVAVLE